MPKRLVRRTVGGRGSRRHLKGFERHGQPGDDRRTMRPLAHAAMAVERLDGCCPDAVAYFAAETAAAENFVHLLTSVPIRELVMTLDIVVLQPLVALIAGILILLIPRLLNYVVAIYLIVIGVIGLWPRLLYHVPH